MSHRVVITRPLPGDPAARFKDAGFEDVWVNPKDAKLTTKELHKQIKGAHAIITTPADNVDKAFFEAAGPDLKVVSNYAVGYDNIDLDEAKARNVAVGHTPIAVTEPTAELTWLLLLAAARRAREGMDLVRSGKWKGVSPNELLGHRVTGKTLFIIGAGRIGYAVARRAPGYRMKVIYRARDDRDHFDRRPINAIRVGLEEGLAQADFISLHVPKNSSTYHMINAERLAMMKPTAVLVNTSRGSVIDEAALYEALKDGKIAAAGLDVFENEPKLHPGLADLPNVFVTPHIGSATEEDRIWMTGIAMNNVISFLRGQRPPHLVSG